MRCETRCTLHQVHAVLDGGAHIVRYDRSGKWYLERGGVISRRRLSLSEAVALALEPGATVHLGCAGGRSFDAAVRKAQARWEWA